MPKGTAYVGRVPEPSQDIGEQRLMQPGAAQYLRRRTATALTGRGSFRSRRALGPLPDEALPP